MNLRDYPEKDTALTIIEATLPNGNLNLILGAAINLQRPYDILTPMSDEKNKEELRPSKMRGVAFPKAKYGVILAVIIIIIVNLIYYKETIFSFLK